MFERMTDAASKVVVRAKDEAESLGHNYIGTEHILLGLLRVEDELGAKALNSLGVTLEAARSAVNDIIGSTSQEPRGQLPFTPLAKSVLERSLREAFNLGTNNICTEHVLMALLREERGVATPLLHRLGVDDTLRAYEEVTKMAQEKR